MAVGSSQSAFHVVPGVRLAALSCGIKDNETSDLVLFEFAEGSNSAGVFTRSLFAAAPVEVGKAHLLVARPRYFLVNSGNANAGVGAEGIGDALTCCQSLSQLTGVRPEAILPFSTGVIGERLPVSNVTNALHRLVGSLSENNWLEAARGIMRTDTRPKIASRQVQINGTTNSATGDLRKKARISNSLALLGNGVSTPATRYQYHAIRGASSENRTAARTSRRSTPMGPLRASATRRESGAITLPHWISSSPWRWSRK